MRKSVRLFSVMLCAALVCACCSLAACNNGNTDPRKSCLVQVEGGTGGGYYYVDTNCTVVAETPAGMQFIKWVSGETDLSSNAEYTFTVTKNIKLKAVFEEDIPDTTLYTVDVHWGNGSGNYFAGKKIQVSVVQEYLNAVFTGWDATYKGANGAEVTEHISDAASFELTVDKDIYITACYDATPLATPNNENGQMFHISDNGAYELDRQKNDNGTNKTAFVPGCAFVLYTAYEKVGEEYVAVGRGKVVPLAAVQGEYHHYMYSMDGKLSAPLKGGSGNIYQDTTDAKAAIRSILNMELNKTYYITAQAKGSDDSPIDSAESAAFAVRL